MKIPLDNQQAPSYHVIVMVEALLFYLEEMKLKPNKLYHCTTPKKAKLYRATGYICFPVRGFDTEKAAMAWCIKTGRTVILELEGWEQEQIHKLPDHHNKFGVAFWVDKNVEKWHCVFSSDSDA